MTAEVPFVTVLIPARNEEADIAHCLEHVLAQDHPHDRIEIVLVDGGSTDATVARAEHVLAAGDVVFKIVDNPVGTTPSNLNAGLRAASGELLCRVDARSFVPPEYVRLCAEVLCRRPDVVVTGGAQVAVARGSDSRSIGIARALNNRYSMGGSRYRSGAESGPSDTVYLGAFRTAQLRGVCGWNEAMLSNQDFELNRRMGRLGVVWFDGRLGVGYTPRRTFSELWSQYHRFGRWKVRYWRTTRDLPRPRQVAALTLGAAAALAGLVFVSAAKHRRRRRVLASVAVVAVGALVVDHAGSGRGSLRLRMFGSAGVVAASVGWLTGVGREALTGWMERSHD